MDADFSSKIILSDEAHFHLDGFVNRQNRPPRSCDLTPLDFFLWGYLKSQVYVNKPTTTRALKEEIQRCINEIHPHLCKMVMENFDKRVRMCMQSRGAICPMCYSTNNPIL
ncbi:hypothetical protein ALC56_09681 [Trachymyrmex septentrionalis]|uniref:Uncharacterized protein n=1 Tax=Trachymyrmex septentrionalis TaxID=34720 RepID=A0A195F5M2_9HYME|nr:hypothetical protein ALC56_09681 [Trachymyrmex septentrionalis]